MGIFDSILPGNKPDEKAVVFKAWSTKDVVEGPKGAGLKGDIEVIFKIGDEDTKTTKCFAGQPLSEVATQVPDLLHPLLLAKCNHFVFYEALLLRRRRFLYSLFMFIVYLLFWIFCWTINC